MLASRCEYDVKIFPRVWLDTGTVVRLALGRLKTQVFVYCNHFRMKRRTAMQVLVMLGFNEN